MKKRILPLFFITLLLFNYGCTNYEASEPMPIQTPRVSSIPSPETEPEPELESEPVCNHFWREPNCNDPYICLDCGETKGTPSEHELTTSNFQAAPECINCGEIIGEPDEPHFISCGYRINTTSGRPFSYITTTSLNSLQSTTGVATLLYIDIFESDSDYPEKTGYEYIQSRFLINFDDENARTDGFQYLTGQLDYYSFDPDEIVVVFDDLVSSDIPGFKVASRKLNFFGEDFEYYIKHEQIQNEWVGNKSYIVFEYTFLAPASYDGLVVYISNAANWSDDDNRILSDNFDNNTLFFRLRAQTN